MKITLEFTNIENFFNELPRFAALMNFSGQFAQFSYKEKSELISSLMEPELPKAQRVDGGTIVSGSPEAVEKTNQPQEIANQTVDMLEKKKKTAKAKAEKAREESAEAAQEKPEEMKAANSTPEEEKPAQEPAAASSEIKDTDVRKIFNKLIKAGHRDEVKAILASFGAANFSDLAKSGDRYFAEAYAKAKEVLDNDSDD